MTTQALGFGRPGINCPSPAERIGWMPNDGYVSGYERSPRESASEESTLEGYGLFPRKRARSKVKALTSIGEKILELVDRAAEYEEEGKIKKAINKTEKAKGKARKALKLWDKLRDIKYADEYITSKLKSMMSDLKKFVESPDIRDPRKGPEDSEWYDEDEDEDEDDYDYDDDEFEDLESYLAEGPGQAPGADFWTGYTGGRPGDTIEWMPGTSPVTGGPRATFRRGYVPGRDLGYMTYPTLARAVSRSGTAITAGQRAAQAGTAITAGQRAAQAGTAITAEQRAAQAGTAITAGQRVSQAARLWSTDFGALMIDADDFLTPGVSAEILRQELYEDIEEPLEYEDEEYEVEEFGKLVIDADDFWTPGVSATIFRSELFDEEFDDGYIDEDLFEDEDEEEYGGPFRRRDRRRDRRRSGSGLFRGRGRGHSGERDFPVLQRSGRDGPRLRRPPLPPFRSRGEKEPLTLEEMTARLHEMYWKAKEGENWERLEAIIRKMKGLGIPIPSDDETEYGAQGTGLFAKAKSVIQSLGSRDLRDKIERLKTRYQRQRVAGDISGATKTYAELQAAQATWEQQAAMPEEALDWDPDADEDLDDYLEQFIDMDEEIEFAPAADLATMEGVDEAMSDL